MYGGPITSEVYSCAEENTPAKKQTHFPKI